MIKWDYIKKEKGVPHMLALRRHCLDYSKVYSVVTKICLLAWDQNKKIAYYIFYILIPNSVLIFFTIAHICYKQISIIRYYWLNKHPELGS